MKIEDLKNKLVAVLGYGQEGKAVAAYLLKHGIKPVLFDQKPWAEWGEEDQNAIKTLKINFIFGPEAFLELKGFDVAFRSPGIRISDVGQARGLLNKPNKTTIFTSQTKWFFNNCPGKIIGVTGTKGKGTTSAMIYEMLKAGKFMTHLTGNIGMVQPLEILDALSADDFIVYELSSFQLQDLDKSPRIGVVLMVTSEHLDYHKNISEYHKAKAAITKFQSADDFSIINHDFPASKSIGALGKGKKLYFSRQEQTKEDCFIKNDEVVIPGSNFKFPITKLQLKGRHNLENVCAASLAAFAVGCNAGAVKKVLGNFKGLEHRLEFVAEKQGIEFYNDSFSTTPETAIAAIESFSEPLIVILGGSSKKSNFSALAKTVVNAKNIKSIILIGQEAGKIKDSLLKAGFSKQKFLEGAGSMPEIFEQVKATAKAGDVVLLSPACASFDMFPNYKNRGEQFKKCVKKW